MTTELLEFTYLILVGIIFLIGVWIPFKIL